MEVTCLQGNIATQSADALVNAAGTSLRMGSGVAGALREAGGTELASAALDAGPIDLGAVAVTDAYALDADYVLHAAAMPHYGDGTATVESIRAATRNSLQTAEDLDCQSLVVPLLGCGVAGMDTETGARTICAVLDAFEGDSLRDVRLIGYSDEEASAIRSIASETFGW